ISGEIDRPRCSKSSPVLTTTSRFSGGMMRDRPRASFAPPTPPDSAMITGRYSLEKILLRRAYHVRHRHIRRAPCQASYDDDGLRFGRLPLQQRGGGGNLIGETDDADLQNAAEQVGLAAQVDHGRNAGGADRHAGGPATPRAAETVADDHADIRMSGERGADRL